MSEVLKASQEAVEAARQGEQFAVMLAAIQAAQAVQAAQTAAQPHHGCSCNTQRPGRSTGQVVAIAAGVCACGMVAAAMFLAVALAAVGVAVSALVCLFVIREIKTQRGK